MQTIVESLKKKNPNNYGVLKNIVDGEIYRKFFVFPNEFSKECFVPFQGKDKIEQRNEQAILKAAIWYSNHLKAMKIETLFLTNSFNSIQNAQQNGLQAMTIFDFVINFANDYIDMIDFIGHQNLQNQDEMIIENEGKQSQFEPHLSSQQLTEQIQTGELFQGKINIDRNNIDEGRVNLRKYDFDIKIIGSNNLNRCLNGDIVAVKLLPEKEWMKNVFVDIEDNQPNNDDHEQNQAEDPNQQQIQEKYQNLIQQIKKQNLIPTGKIVGIVKRNQRNYCGSITPTIVKQLEKGEIREFIPVDSRYPHFYIRLLNGKTYEKKRIIIVFDNWPENLKYPFAHLKRILGNEGDLFTEGDVILYEHNFDYRFFSKQVLNCLIGYDDKWQIPEEQLKTRLDLRGINVCSIDPVGCKDIDDALHCVRLENGNFEVGVHIADVSYFVRPDTAIDLEAANRCTTVYLVDRRTDMLPKILTENLCSLKQHVDRLSFSVIWELDQDANIVNVKYSKTIIHSVASLNYEQAQKMIDDKNDNSELTKSLRDLNFLAKKIKLGRVEKGALSLASTQVKFTFDDETNNPVDVQLYNLFETNSLVEEFMLLANVAVAEKIFAHFPSISILRRHPQPKPIQIRQLSIILQSIGFKFDYSTNKALAESLDKVSKLNDPFFNKLVRIMTTRCMNEAVYFCTSEADRPEFYHYGLACQLYTHFTSPIRRYADILVHRLLAASIDVDSLPNTMSNKIKMNKICEKMNMRHRMARFAGRSSSDYHSYMFFKNKDLEEIAIVSSINRLSVVVLIPRYGFEGNIKFSEKDQQINESYVNSQVEDRDIITEFFINGNKLKLFDYLKVKVNVELKSFHKQVNIEFIEPLKN